MNDLRLDISYLRYSDHKQDDGFSIEYQTTEVEQYAERHGMSIDKFYIDKAQTATKVAGREEFFALVNDVKAGKIKTIIVYKLSRMFRNTLESSKYRELFRKHNVKLISITQAVDEDTSEGRLQLNIMSSVDQYQSEIISDHVKSSMREMARQGYYTGGVVAYGFDLEEVPHGKKARKVFIPHPVEAPVVKRIFEMYASGMSVRLIRDALNAEGVKTKKGNSWAGQQIVKLLNNDIYIGIYRFKTKGYDDLVIEGKMPALIDKILWYDVQELKKQKQKFKSPVPRQTKVLYSLTGKIFCENCGGYFNGRSFQSQNSTVEEYYYYYGCGNKYRFGTCKSKLIRKEYLENATLNAIKKHILNDDKIKEISEMVIEFCKKSPSDIQEKIRFKTSVKKQTENKITNLLSALAGGSSEYGLRMITELEEELKKIEKDIFVLNERLKNELTTESIIRYMNNMLVSANSTNGDELKAIFDSFVDKITVNDISATITLNAFGAAPVEIPKEPIDITVYKN